MNTQNNKNFFKMNNNKFSRYFALEKEIKSQGKPIDRKELLDQYTEGMITSFKQMSPGSFTAFCDWIEKSYGVKKDEDWQNSPENVMRRKIIAIFKGIGYVIEGGKADMEAIDAWCIKRGYLHKHLNHYTAKELPTLVTQAERVSASHIDAVTK